LDVETGETQEIFDFD
jgi:hypothetical protein